MVGVAWVALQELPSTSALLEALPAHLFPDPVGLGWSGSLFVLTSSQGCSFRVLGSGSPRKDSPAPGGETGP